MNLAQLLTHAQQACDENKHNQGWGVYGTGRIVIHAPFAITQALEVWPHALVRGVRRSNEQYLLSSVQLWSSDHDRQVWQLASHAVRGNISFPRTNVNIFAVINRVTTKDFLKTTP